jgi:hypothetical protein
MSISTHPELETKIRALAEAKGLSIEAYLERLVQADRQGTEELEALALEGSSLALRSRWAPPTGKTSIANSMNV